MLTFFDEVSAANSQAAAAAAAVDRSVLGQLRPSWCSSTLLHPARRVFIHLAQLLFFTRDVGIRHGDDDLMMSRQLMRRNLGLEEEVVGSVAPGERNEIALAFVFVSLKLNGLNVRIFEFAPSSPSSPP